MTIKDSKRSVFIQRDIPPIAKKAEATIRDKEGSTANGSKPKNARKETGAKNKGNATNMSIRKWILNQFRTCFGMDFILRIMLRFGFKNLLYFVINHLGK